jgi:hypothetical protein
VFRCSSDALATSLRVLFAHHLVADDRTWPAPRIEIDLYIDDRCEARACCVVEGGSGSRRAWRWTLAPATASALPNRLYYWAILPIVVRALGAEDVLRLHAAALASDWSAGIVVLGPSGAGKSTAAAGWIAGGGALIADDTVFAREVRSAHGSEFWWFGLRRPLHIGPDVLPHLTELKGLRSAIEYLPGRGKVAYDWWADCPTRTIAAIPGPRHVILSAVGDSARTRVDPATADAVAEALWEGIAPDGGPVAARTAVVERCLEALHGARAWKVTWGRDVWSDPRRHYGLVRKLIDESPSPLRAATVDALRD